MVIGKGGSEIEKLRNKLNSLTKSTHQCYRNQKVDLDAKLVAKTLHVN